MCNQIVHSLAFGCKKMNLSLSLSHSLSLLSSSPSLFLKKQAEKTQQSHIKTLFKYNPCSQEMCSYILLTGNNVFFLAHLFFLEMFSLQQSKAKEICMLTPFTTVLIKDLCLTEWDSFIIDILASLLPHNLLVLLLWSQKLAFLVPS